MTKHPAKYTDSFLPIFAHFLEGRDTVLDPFGGTGKIGEIKNYGYTGRVVCSEIEEEWAVFAQNNPLVDISVHGDSSNMDWCHDGFFSAICTSPVYGNRMSDHFNSKDDSRRITYRHYLGRNLDENNAGRMNWGKKYRQLHIDVYKECRRVLEDEGLFILNISDHIRAGEIIPVSAWHREALEYLGLVLEETINVETPRHRFGANSTVRVEHEHVMIFKLYK